MESRNWKLALCMATVLVMGLGAAALPARAAAVDCPARADWLNQQRPPAEVTSPGDCGFEQFSWQWFLYLLAGDPPELLRWMRAEDQFASQPPLPWSSRVKFPITGTLEKEGQAASHLPLYDLESNLVEYEQRVNRTQYEYVSGVAHRGNAGNPGKITTQLGFNATVARFEPNLSNYEVLYRPVGSVETKAAWLTLGKEIACPPDTFCLCDPERFYCSRDDEANEIALVGLHIVTRTQNHQAMIWSTFEHVDNAPDCSAVAPGPVDSPKRDWTFFRGGQTCSPTALKEYFCPQPTGFCNCWRSTGPASPPAQICRENAVTYPPVVAINESVQGNAAFGIFRNYMLVGTMWLDDAKGPPFSAKKCKDKAGKVVLEDGEPVYIYYPYLEGSIKGAGCANIQATGLFGGSTKGTTSPALSNTTMETYLQGIHCFVCHENQAENAVQPPQYLNYADFSFYFDHIVAQKAQEDEPAADTARVPASALELRHSAKR